VSVFRPELSSPGIIPADAARRDATASLVGRERRESERAIAYFERIQAACGGVPTLAKLDLGRFDTPAWASRFIISVDRVVEDSLLILCGAKLARLIELPAGADRASPIVRHLPIHLWDVFLQGCSEVVHSADPVRLEGSVARDDGKLEFYRAAFMRIGVKPNSLTHLAFGAFNSRIEKN
jgi:hypothetical protein